MGNEIVFEVKKYISASRASKLSGYNPDYIGQLCRNKDLECMMVARVWFVTEKSLENHKKAASLTPRGRIPNHKKIRELLVVSDSDLKSEQIIYSVNESDNVPVKSDHVLTKPEQVTANVENQNKSLQETISSFKPEAVQGISSSKSFVLSFIKKNKSSLVILFLLAMVPSLFFINKGISNPILNSNSFTVVNSQNNLANSNRGFVGETLNIAHRTITDIESFLSNSTQKFLSLILGPKKSEIALKKNTEEKGFVIVPSANDKNLNDQVKEYVLSSFSDETEIVPGESGNSGLIKPVFKNPNDQEYLYVMVPVKEE